jgi:hypothetical protein
MLPGLNSANIGGAEDRHYHRRRRSARASCGVTVRKVTSVHSISTVKTTPTYQLPCRSVLGRRFSLRAALMTLLVAGESHTHRRGPALARSIAATIVLVFASLFMLIGPPSA